MLVTQPHKRVATRKVAIRLNPYWREDERKNPWGCFLERAPGVSDYATYKDLRIVGTCASESFMVPNVGKRAHTVLHECIPDENAGVLHLTSAAFDLPPVVMIVATDIMVRLNTEWLEDQTQKPWRVLVLVNGDFVEYFVDDFCIHGTCYGKRYDFPEPIGRKMHIACSGYLSITGAESQYVFARINTIRA